MYAAYIYLVVYIGPHTCIVTVVSIVCVAAYKTATCSVFCAFSIIANNYLTVSALVCNLCLVTQFVYISFIGVLLQYIHYL